MRLERAWVLSQAAYKTANRGVPAWPGDRRARQQLANGPELDLDSPLLARQLPTGTWGMYRRASAALGLIAPARGHRGSAPSQTRLTETGEALAEAWWVHNVRQDDRRALANRLTRGRITGDQLKWAFRADVPPFDGLSDTLTQALDGVEPAFSALSALRSVWDLPGADLSPERLLRHRAKLTDRQRAVVDQAAAVVQLVSQIELPYRDYLRDPSRKPLAANVAKDPAWALVPARETEVHELHAALAASPRDWAGLDEWAAVLAGRRGGSSVQPGLAPAGYDNAERPALSLMAAAALFSQGLLGEPQDASTASRRMKAAARHADGGAA